MSSHQWRSHSNDILLVRQLSLGHTSRSALDPRFIWICSHYQGRISWHSSQVHILYMFHHSIPVTMFFTVGRALWFRWASPLCHSSPILAESWTRAWTGRVFSRYKLSSLIPITLDVSMLEFFYQASTFPSENATLYPLSSKAEMETRFLSIPGT